MNTKAFLAALSTIRPSATFLSVRGYTSNEGEISDFSIIFHMNYKNALQKSLDILDIYVPENDLETEAKTALMTSWRKSLDKMNETKEESVGDAYHRVTDADGDYLPGVKIHTATNTLHLYGLVNSKRVHKKVDRKPKNSKELTIAKDRISANCPVSRFRQFVIAPDKVDSIIVEKMELLPPRSLT